MSEINDNRENEDFNSEFIKLLKYFMELCNVGQYNVRLRILDSLYFYLKSFNQHENGLLFIIGSIYSYYQRFQKQINDYVQIETVAMAVEATQYDEER